MNEADQARRGTLATEFGNLHFLVNDKDHVAIFTDPDKSGKFILECHGVPYSLTAHLERTPSDNWMIVIRNTWLRRADRIQHDQPTDSAVRKVLPAVVAAWKQRLATEPHLILLGEVASRQSKLERAESDLKEAEEALAAATVAKQEAQRSLDEATLALHNAQH